MKTVYFSFVLIATTLSVHANNFSMPSWGNNGSSWSMPNMNMGNGNKNNNTDGTSWSMPSMNFGNSGNNGSGFNNGSNWSMPAMNWGNGNNAGSNWFMPNLNWNNNNQPFNFGNNVGNSNNTGYAGIPAPSYYIPGPQANIQYRAPVAPRPPQFMPHTPQKNIPASGQRQLQHQQQNKAPVASTRIAPVQQPRVKMPAPMNIPMPSEVKGVILAPENKLK